MDVSNTVLTSMVMKETSEILGGAIFDKKGGLTDYKRSTTTSLTFFRLVVQTNIICGPFEPRFSSNGYGADVGDF